MRGRVNVDALRAKGVRLHHFYDRNGRLVGTIATRGVDGDADSVAVAAAICAKTDTPDKEFGRRLALRRLRDGESKIIPLWVLKVEIRRRTILAMFPGGQHLTGLRPAAPWHPTPVPAVTEPDLLSDMGDLPF